MLAVDSVVRFQNRVLLIGERLIGGDSGDGERRVGDNI